MRNKKRRREEGDRGEVEGIKEGDERKREIVEGIKEGDERKREIVEGTDKIKERSRILLLDAEFNLKKVIEWREKIERKEEGRGRWGVVGYDKREEERERELIREGEILMGRIRIGEREMREMDKEYERLRGIVNGYYGKEVMRGRK